MAKYVIDTKTTNSDNSLKFIVRFYDDSDVLLGTGTYNNITDSAAGIKSFRSFLNDICKKLNDESKMTGTLVANDEATVPVAEVIYVTDHELITFGDGTFSIDFDATTSRLYNKHTGGAAVGQLRVSIRLPENFSDFPSNALSVDTYRSGSTNSLTVTILKNGAADSIINALNIKPSLDVTWETKTSSFGSAYSAGDLLTLEISSDLASLTENRVDNIFMKYNKKSL